MNTHCLLSRPYTEGVVVHLTSGQVCSICLDNDLYTYKSWVSLNRCTHQFHRHCLDLWLERNRTCPLCVQDVFEVPQRRELTLQEWGKCIGFCGFLLVIVITTIILLVVYWPR